ncbi:M20/M25/M40 family metallo-hydrolase [Streptomyces sp. NPDC049813]|uniref:M20/M25/M40 family metallo-hydrolase n=1 Tax=Streptomyces sp. NPDC049813 TaxID=3365597 RepID=UPI00379C3F32
MSRLSPEHAEAAAPAPVKHPDEGAQAHGADGLFGAVRTRRPQSCPRCPSGSAVSADAHRGRCRGVALRADMDALPVKEETGLPYASTVTAGEVPVTAVTGDGREVPVTHACGHAVHVTALLGMCARLASPPTGVPGSSSGHFAPLAGPSVETGVRLMTTAAAHWLAHQKAEPDTPARAYGLLGPLPCRSGGEGLLSPVGGAIVRPCVLGRTQPLADWDVPLYLATQPAASGPAWRDRTPGPPRSRWTGRGPPPPGRGPGG